MAEEAGGKQEPQKNVQILMKVPPEVKRLAQQEANLAHQYGWISTPTITQLFRWLITYYLALGIKNFIAKRRASAEVSSEGKEEEGG